MTAVRPALHVVTLAVRDQAVSRRFYGDGLGWPHTGDIHAGVTFLELPHGPLLSLWSIEEMRAEIGELTLPAPGTSAPVTLAHNVDSPAEVDAVLDAAEAAGAAHVQPGQARVWGGYSGYFVDPDGWRWEVAHNPGLRREADGTVRIGAIA